MRFLVLLLPIFLIACSTTPRDTMRKVSAGANQTATAVTSEKPADDVDRLGDTKDIGDAVLTPLQDMNIRKVDIPDMLETMETPYFPPLIHGCEGLIAEIEEYDALLGPDFDDTSEEAESRRERAALNAASSIIGGLVPFRGVIRAATGASSHDKRVERAYRRGVTRRGYLKGLAKANDCDLN